jgi:hypothetical protein
MSGMGNGSTVKQMCQNGRAFEELVVDVPLKESIQITNVNAKHYPVCLSVCLLLPDFLEFVSK